jgi:hypothetical protein
LLFLLHLLPLPVSELSIYRNANADWLAGFWYDRHKHVIWMSPMAYLPAADPDASETLDDQGDAATREFLAGIGAFPSWFERADIAYKHAAAAEKAKVASRVAAEAARPAAVAAAPPIPASSPPSQH